MSNLGRPCMELSRLHYCFGGGSQLASRMSSNLHDYCVMNEKQCSILWHVDDLKMSHIDASVVTAAIAQLKAIFGVKAPLTKAKGG